MLYPDKMERPLSDGDRAWLKGNNLGHIADQFDAEDAENQAIDTETFDYADMTVKDLKAEIERRNTEITVAAEKLSTEGKKDDLIATLQADDEALAAGDDE